MKSPLVSVVMAAYNAQEYLNIAIDSILLQTYQNLELIIVDDGSTDSTPTIVGACSDSRIRYFRQKNKGLPAALNFGISKTAGKYIARMDADDISHPERLKKQVEYLEKNNSVALLGTSFNIIDESNCTIGRSYHLARNEDLQVEFLVRNPFGHGTIMVRRDALEAGGGYDENQVIEDYDLWWRIAKNHQVANLTEFLYSWRVVASGISHGSSDKRQKAIHEIVSRIWRETKPNLSTNQIQSGLRHYEKLGPQYHEQFTYMLAAFVVASSKMGRYWLSAKLISKILSIPGLRLAIKDTRKNPLSHNYLLKLIYKD